MNFEAEKRYSYSHENLQFSSIWRHKVRVTIGRLPGRGERVGRTRQSYRIFRKINVNEGRFVLFSTNYKIKDINEPFQKKSLRCFDATSLPPCQDELGQHLLRAKYIANLWSHANQKIPTIFNPVDCGWVEVKNQYQFKWYEGDQVPASVRDIIEDENSEGTFYAKLSWLLYEYLWRFFFSFTVENLSEIEKDEDSEYDSDDDREDNAADEENFQNTSL